jgi:hypothetical protein
LEVKLKKLTKKGMLTMSDLPNVALILLLTGIFFTISIVILTGMTNISNVGNGSQSTTANYSIQKVITALGEIPSNWILLIAIVVAAAVIIGIVVSNLGGSVQGRV